MRGCKARELRKLIWGPNKSQRQRDPVKINQRVYTVDKLNFWSTFTVLDKGCRGVYLEMKKQERGNRAC